ncbi:DUF3237 domain-containing protein [Nocardia sp. BMG51109]|uniref:DUF3237 domain-containing protein n=1 Tax=Nocardia sp. BMG51109 TaxID=1056816 RepID=UPI000466E84E|nr:DUF3237 domain-containing protein [Nocardia sp. BMG51109]
MELTRIGTVTANLKPPVMIGPGPHGLRIFVEILDGVLEGDPNVTAVQSITGKVLSGGGDWALIGADGWVRLDVRVQFQTVGSGVIYANFPGLLEMNDRVQQAFSEGSATDFGDQYFRVTPRLETGDNDLAWVNHTVFVGEGRFIEGFGLRYNMFRVG